MSDFAAEMVQTPGTIVSTSYHGSTTQYLVSVGTGVTLTVLEQNLPRMRADNRWEPGDRVQVGWHPEHAVVTASEAPMTRRTWSSSAQGSPG